MAGVDPISAGLGVLGGVGSYLAGASANKASKELLRRQAQYANLQNKQYLQSLPLYNQALGEYARMAGLGPGGQGLNAYGMTPEDATRLRLGEEDIGRRQQQQGNQLRFSLGQRGLANASIGAALGRNQRQGQEQYSQFRRGLAVNAPYERYQRLGQLQSALGPALGAGGQAAQIYGQQGAYQGQQAQQQFGNLGNIVNQLMYQRSLGNYSNQYGVNPGGAYGGYGGQGTPQLKGYNPYDTGGLGLQYGSRF